jgi:hypothetical protein
MMKNNLYFRNVSRRWKKEASKSEELVFFSPYITSSTAETVLLLDGGPDCTIYTCFNAENFACRASSLKTLKKLIQNGCELFHIEGLHAKVMINDDFISVGSQNLTNKGRTNLEASFCSQDPSFIRYGQNAIEDWISLAEEITLKMIEDMEDEISSLIIEYDKIKKLFKAADDAVIEKEKTRQRIEEDRLKKILEIKDRLKSLEKNARAAIKSNRFVFAIVKQLTNVGEYDETYTYSLVPSSGNFTHWIVEDKRKVLETKHRYLFMDTETGKIGWARVNKGRITYFADGVSRTEKIKIGNWVCQVSFDANWSKTRTDYNLSITIKYPSSDVELVYRCFFDLQFISNLHLDSKNSKGSFDLDKRKLWNEQNKPEFSNYIAKQLLSPFVYSTKLYGKQANKFFKYPPTKWSKVSLAKVRGYYILLSEPNN